MKSAAIYSRSSMGDHDRQREELHAKFGEMHGIVAEYQDNGPGSSALKLLVSAERTKPKLRLASLGSVKIIHGANDGIFNIVGASVASVRASLVDAFNIPDDAVAFVNGELILADHRLEANDTLEFVKQRGCKGVGDQVWTEEEFCKFFKITPEDLRAWIAQGLTVKRCLDGSVRITETAMDEFNRGRVIEAPLVSDLPKEVSTEEAATILGLSKDTVLKLRAAGLLEFRNAAPPGSSRPVYRFLLESVVRLRTSYETDEPTPKMPREPRRGRVTPQSKKYKHVKLED